MRLADIADIEDGLEDHRQFASFKGQPTVGLGIVKVQNSNSVAIVEEVKHRLESEIIPDLPPGRQAFDSGLWTSFSSTSCFLSSTFCLFVSSSLPSNH